MRALQAQALRAFARAARASAGIELALGAAVLIPVAMLCFDLYSRVEADTRSAHLAAVMADYVSRGPDTAGGALDGSALEALGKFLHERALGVPAHLVFVISALRQPAGEPSPAVEVVWFDDTLRFVGSGGDDATFPADLAGDCSRLLGDDADGDDDAGQTTATLPAGFTMDADEVAVVVEVCARLTREGSLTGKLVSGDLYRLHVLPFRDAANVPSAPTHARLGAGPLHAGLAAARA